MRENGISDNMTGLLPIMETSPYPFVDPAV